MAKMLPSVVVREIDRLFPNLAGMPRIGWSHDHRTALVTVLMLLDEIPAQHLADLSTDDDVLRKRALVAVRDIADHWTRTDERTLRTTSGHALEQRADFGNRNALQVIRDILAKCPDEAPDDQAPGLAFLVDPALAGDLRRDMTSARSTLANGEYKLSCVMAGSVIEALLLWALKRKGQPEREAALAAWRAAGGGAPGALPADWNDWKLFHLINIARRIAPHPLLSAGAANAADSAREFRNLIHPERAATTRPTVSVAEIAVGAMGRVAEELEALAKAGHV